jgi:hypothetical protein
MKTMSEKTKKEVLKDLEMYFGKPPYNSEHVRHHISSGLFEEQALMKYGYTPIELMIGLEHIQLSKKLKAEALKDLKMYFGEPPVSKEALDKRLTSGLLEMQILAKYLMTVEDLMKEVGFKVSKLKPKK